MCMYIYIYSYYSCTEIMPEGSSKPRAAAGHPTTSWARSSRSTTSVSPPGGINGTWRPNGNTEIFRNTAYWLLCGTNMRRHLDSPNITFRLEVLGIKIRVLGCFRFRCLAFRGFAWFFDGLWMVLELRGLQDDLCNVAQVPYLSFSGMPEWLLICSVLRVPRAKRCIWPY